MTRNEAIEIILGRCGNRRNDELLRDACIREMALTQETTLEQADFKPWFLLSEFMRARTGQFEPRMPLPELFLEEHEEGLLWIQQADGRFVPLNRDDVDKLEQYYLGQPPRKPEQYGVVKNYAYLFPTPDTSYQLKMRCYLREPKLMYAFTEEGTQAQKTNAWLTYAADWIIGETGKKIVGSYLKDRETAAEFASEAAEAKKRLYVQHIAREEANRERSAGDD